MTEPSSGSARISPWETPLESRRKRADHYFHAVLEGQQDWYSRKAGAQKLRYQGFAVLVILLGAVISVLQLWGETPWVPVATAVCGALVAVLRSVDTLLRPGETWQAYRKAAESMKREYRLYLTGAETYAENGDEEAAFRLLVSRVETVIAEEQKLFWQFSGKRAESHKAKDEP